jgi:hypothetical protein
VDRFTIAKLVRIPGKRFDVRPGRSRSTLRLIEYGSITAVTPATAPGNGPVPGPVQTPDLVPVCAVHHPRRPLPHMPLRDTCAANYWYRGHSVLTGLSDSLPTPLYLAPPSLRLHIAPVPLRAASAEFAPFRLDSAPPPHRRQPGGDSRLRLHATSPSDCARGSIPDRSCTHAKDWGTAPGHDGRKYRMAQLHPAVAAVMCHQAFVLHPVDP